LGGDAVQNLKEKVANFTYEQFLQYNQANNSNNNLDNNQDINNKKIYYGNSVGNYISNNMYDEIRTKFANWEGYNQGDAINTTLFSNFCIFINNSISTSKNYKNMGNFFTREHGN